MVGSLNHKTNRTARTIPITILIALILLLSHSLISAKSLTLDEALKTAFANSPNMQRVTFSLITSEENLKAQNAALKSQFRLTLRPFEYSKRRVFDESRALYNTIENKTSSAIFSIDQPIKWTDGMLSLSDAIDWRDASSSLSMFGTEPTYNNSLNLSLTQPIFTYNRTKLETERLELSLESARLSYAIQKLQVESQVTQQFLNLYLSYERVKISEEEYANAQASYEIIENKVGAGISAKEELYQADLTRANSLAGLQNNRIQFENSLDNFKILIGLPLESEIDVITDVRKKLVDVNLQQAIEQGLKNRRVLRQRDIEIQYALHDLIRTGAQNEFKGSVELSYGLTGEDVKFRDLYNSPTRDQRVSLTLNIPLFDWGEKKHRLSASRAQVANSRLSADDQKNQVVLEIRQAVRILENQNIQIEIAEKNVRNARLTYEINLERYKNGDLSSKEIEFYQNQLSNEQLREATALVNYQIALLDIKIMSLWDFENNRPVIGLKEKDWK